MNNVGRMYDGPDAIGHVPEDLLWDMVNINCGAVTMMTRLLLRGMVDRRKGAIVNISSGSELQPMPYMAVYGATKVITMKSCKILFIHMGKNSRSISKNFPIFFHPFVIAIRSTKK